MDENLDPDKIKEANQELGNLNEGVKDVNSSLKELRDQLDKLNKLTKSDILKNTTELNKKQKVQIEGLDDLADAFDESSDAVRKSTTTQERMAEEISASMGYIKDATGTYVSKMQEEATIRKQIEEQIIKQIGKETYVRNIQQDLFNRELQTLGVAIDQNGKFIKTTIELTDAQKEQIEAAKQFVDKQKNAAEAAQSMTTKVTGLAKTSTSIESALSVAAEEILKFGEKNKLGAGAMLGLTVGVGIVSAGLQSLKKVFDASIDAQIQYTKSLLAGQRGQGLVAKQQETVGKAANDLTRKLGDLSIAAGTAGIALSLMAPWSIPLKLIGVAASAAAVGLGFYAQVQAKASDTALEFNTQIAELKDSLFNGMTELGKATLVGAGGMTALGDNLAKLQMSFAEVGKFTNIVKGATKELAMLGPTTVGGLNKFVDAASSLIKSDLGKQLEIMGITNEQQAEHVLNFMTLQERLGIKQEKDAAKLGAAAELRAKMLSTTDEKEKKLLEQQILTVEAMYASGAKELAAGTARLIANGGVLVDDITVKASQTAGKAIGNLISGTGTPIENILAISKEASEYSKQFAEGIGRIDYKAIDPIITKFSETANLASKTQQLQDLMIKNPAMKPDELIKKLITVTDKQAKDQVELLRQQREKAIKDQIDATQKFGAASNLFRIGVDGFNKAVDKWLGKPEGAGDAGSAPASGPLRQEQETKQKEVAAINDKIKSIEQELKNTDQLPVAKEKQLREDLVKLKEELVKAEKDEIDASRKVTVNNYKLAKEKREQMAARREIPKIERDLAEQEKKLQEVQAKPATKQNQMQAAQLQSDVDKTREKLEATKKQATGGYGVATTSKQLQEAGLDIKEGAQSEYAGIDPKLIELAKKVKKEVPGFVKFTSFNDDLHADRESLHRKGLAFDFTIDHHPDPKEAETIISQIKKLGANIALDEYNKPSDGATGKHFHAALQAKFGGLFSGPKSGYPVELHGDEVVIPIPKLNDFTENMEKVKKTSLENAMTSITPAGDTSSDSIQLSKLISLQSEMIEIISTKLDALDSRLAKSNDIQENILTYSAA